MAADPGPVDLIAEADSALQRAIRSNAKVRHDVTRTESVNAVALADSALAQAAATFALAVEVRALGVLLSEAAGVLLPAVHLWATPSAVIHAPVVP